MLDGGGGGFWSCEALGELSVAVEWHATGYGVLRLGIEVLTVGARDCLIEYVRCILRVL